jgi:cytochrome b561
MADARKTRYSTLSIAMHWAMVLLIAGVYLCIELVGDYPKGSPEREFLKHWHFTLGLTVFVLVWLRLLFRLLGGVPPISPAPPAWQARLGGTVHVLLYILMIAMPIGGWLILSGADKPVPFYGFELPHLMGPNKELAEQIGDIHETIGNIGYFLIGLHAVAGLYHHYLQRDNTLRRMLPWGQ